ncbi:hypothetical protein CsSME_00038675 [Camellia sinensis var. sinensis]
MSQFLLVCLILANAFVLNVASSFPNLPYPSPRKLGNHHVNVMMSSVAPCLSPSRAPESEAVNSVKEVSASDQVTWFIPGQQVRIEKQHRSIDRSVAGGGVILGGLATTFLVAVFCYIRATGKKNAEPEA